jgi:outer membrane protein
MNTIKWVITLLYPTLFMSSMMAWSAQASLVQATSAHQELGQIENAHSESTQSINEIIDEYVRDGLGSNLALQGATLEVERSQAALDAARARFLPEASIVARYTRADGGREISLPLAAAFNPVYGTLNELLLADGQAPRFGLIEDPRFLLQREREQDTRLAIRQPLFVPAIPAAVRAQKAALAANDFAHLALSQRLRRDITVGYLDWLQADRAARILSASQKLLEENLRVTRALFENGVITRDQVLRAEAESLALTQQRIEIDGGVNQLRAYVNFLLNRGLDTALKIGHIDTELDAAARDLATLRAAALDQRAELSQIRSATAVAAARRDLARAERLPTLALAIDGGTQGERYEFGRGRNFATLSLLLNWTLFDGGARRADERAARLVERQFGLRSEELRQSIQLEVQQALDALLAAEAATRAATARAEAARAAFTIATRKRDAGVISQVEFIDAQTTLTAAELDLNRLRFAVISRQAELDYATGGSSLSPL